MSNRKFAALLSARLIVAACINELTHILRKRLVKR
jgi:hypothetical protein